MPITRADLLALLVIVAAAILLGWCAYLAPRSTVLDIVAPPVLLPLKAWHAPETASEQTEHYRWTQAQSLAALPNPGGRVALRLRLASGTSQPVPLQLTAADTSIAFTVTPGWRQYRFLLDAPPAERLNLTLQSPTMLVNQRHLGLMVSQFALFGGGSLPLHVLIALICASSSVYVLIRTAGLQPATSAAIIIALQASLLGWQSIAGWHYALLVPLSILLTVTALLSVLVDHCTLPCATWHAPHFPPIDWRHIVAVWLLALLVRLPWFGAPDPVGDMELAARRMRFLFHEGLAGAYLFDGDYMPLRLYLLTGLSQWVRPLGGTFDAPLTPSTMSLIKLPALVADLLTLLLLWWWSRRWVSAWRATAITALYALAPPVWINVAWWGQVDALLMLPMVAMVVLFERASGRWSWWCWAMALLIKPQAIVLAPVLYAATLCRYRSRGVLIGAAIAAVTLLVGMLPLLLAGQTTGLLQAALGSVGRFPRVTAGAYNLWYVMAHDSGALDTELLVGPLSYRLVGLLLLGSVTLLIVWRLLHHCHALTIALAAAVLALAFFSLPTQIHERYLFLCLAFLALTIAARPLMVLPFVLLTASATLNILGTLDGFIGPQQDAIAASALPWLLASLNLLLLLWLLLDLLFRPTTSQTQPTQTD
ncbi:MAG: hypothetical protein HC837_00885 [Chloroflexaceae bacterium]|nr:hypothetical protein [Chloroflexaceae bacterium]